MPHYAERFADAGYTVLTFDPRHLGASEGEPRGHNDPSLVIEDTLNALRYLRTRKDVDASNLALVGVCFGGGIAISAAAQDPLVRTISSIVGGYDIGGSFQLLIGAEKFADYYKQIAHVVQHEYETHRVAYVPTVVRAQSPETPVAFMAGDEAYTYDQRYANNGGAERWNPQTTAAGLIPYFAYSAVAHVKLVAPRPVQIIHGTRDLFCFPTLRKLFTTRPPDLANSFGSTRITTSSSTIKTHTYRRRAMRPLHLSSRSSESANLRDDKSGTTPSAAA